MRSGFAILLIATVLFGGGYWYFEASAICDVPIAYSIGSIDERFNISVDEARTAVSAAESMWEDATGRNLFTYDETADFSINFVYDDRQQYTEAERDLREDLEERGSENDSLRQRYERLLDEYESLRASYEQQSAEYEQRLREYNAEVERWNEAGGAPEDVYEDLSERKEELSAEQERLNGVATELNQLINEMNAVASEGNLVLDDYNQIVEEYNERFSEDREFTQGDYQGEYINIYQYDSEDELVIVLAHEFGHALSVPHVEGQQSIMYHFMEHQSVEEGLTEYDVVAFEEICGEDNFTLWSIF